MAPHDVIEQVAALAVLSDEQESVALLEHFKELQDVWMVKSAQNSHFVPKVFQLLCRQPVSQDDLYCSQLATRPLDTLSYLSKRAGADLCSQLVTITELAAFVLDDEVRAAEG